MEGPHRTTIVPGSSARRRTSNRERTTRPTGCDRPSPPSASGERSARVTHSESVVGTALPVRLSASSHPGTPPTVASVTLHRARTERRRRLAGSHQRKLVADDARAQECSVRPFEQRARIRRNERRARCERRGRRRIDRQLRCDASRDDAECQHGSCGDAHYSRTPQIRSRSSRPTRTSRPFGPLFASSTPASASWSMMRAARP